MAVMVELPKHADGEGCVYSVVNTIGEHNFFGLSVQIVGIWPLYIFHTS